MTESAADSPAPAPLPDLDETWAAQTLVQVLDHLRVHAHAGCASCTAWVRGQGGTVAR